MCLVALAAASFYPQAQAQAQSTLSVWEDPSNSASAEYVLNNRDALFTARENAYVGPSKSTWWVQVSLENLTKKTKTLFPAMPYQRMSNVDAISLQRGDLEIFQNGTAVPVDQRDVRTGVVAFAVTLNPGESHEVFLRIRAPGLVLLDYEVLEVGDLIAAERLLFLKGIGALGILIAFILVNLVYFFSTCNPLFIYYIFYMLCVGCLVAERFSGIAYLGISSADLYWSYTYSIGAMLYMSFSGVVLRLFKNLRSVLFTGPLYASIATSGALLATSFINVEWAGKLYTMGLGMAAPTLITVSLTVALYRGETYARMAILGWSFALVGAVLSILYYNGVLGAQYTGIAAWGFLAETCVFTLILAANTRHNDLLEVFERKQRDQMERTAQLATIGEMSATVSHELKQPLNAIRLTVANMMRSISRESSGADSNLLGKLERIDGMIDRAFELTDYVRRSSRRTVDDQPITNLVQNLAGCHLMLDQDFAASNIKVTEDIADDLPDLLIHPLRLDQILLNILGNARDVIRTVDPEARWIRIAAASSGVNRVEITIEDSAGGVPAELLDKVFDRFFTTKGADTGTGLGLAICRDIVEDVGGTVSVSNTASGAVFTISLPCVQSDGPVDVVTL